MTDEKRPYRKKRRAELEEQTRRRITESAVALHGTVGPSRTSMSAIAEHAGVRRSTLYRHFPDEVAVFQACSAHWAADHPPPDLGAWAAIEDPDQRLATALGELYAYYRSGEPMLANLQRDEPLVPTVKQFFRGYHELIAAARDALMRGRRTRGRARTRVLAAIGHALAFGTWRSLAREEGLDDAEAAALMCRLVREASA
jgi:AcrR family transcriptional regulator